MLSTTPLYLRPWRYYNIDVNKNPPTSDQESLCLSWDQSQMFILNINKIHRFDLHTRKKVRVFPPRLSTPRPLTVGQTAASCDKPVSMCRLDPTEKTYLVLSFRPPSFGRRKARLLVTCMDGHGKLLYPAQLIRMVSRFRDAQCKIFLLDQTWVVVYNLGNLYIHKYALDKHAHDVMSPLEKKCCVLSLQPDHCVLGADPLTTQGMFVRAHGNLLLCYVCLQSKKIIPMRAWTLFPTTPFYALQTPMFFGLDGFCVDEHGGFIYVVTKTDFDTNTYRLFQVLRSGAHGSSAKMVDIGGENPKDVKVCPKTGHVFVLTHPPPAAVPSSTYIMVA